LHRLIYGKPEGYLSAMLPTPQKSQSGRGLASASDRGGGKRRVDFGEILVREFKRRR